MIKSEELSNPKSCMSKADDDEMTFVLLARDEAAPSVIRHWANLRVQMGKNVSTDAQIQEALTCADKMEAQHRAGEFTKIPILKITADNGSVHYCEDLDFDKARADVSTVEQVMMTRKQYQRIPASAESMKFFGEG